MRVLLLDPVLDGHHLDVIARLAKYLREAGDRTTLLTWCEDPLLDELAPEERPDEIRWVADQPFPGGRIARALRWRRMFVAARAIDTDLIHHLNVDGSEPGMALASITGGLPSPMVAYLFKPHGRTLRQRTARAIVRRFLRRERISHLFTINGGAHAFGGGASILPIPVDPHPEPRPAPGGSIPNALFFGGARRDKGLDVLAAALPSLPRGLRVTIAGVGVEAGARVGAIVTEADVRVDTGFVPRGKVPALFSDADLVVLPYRSTFHAGSGILARAVAATRPVIATDVGRIGDEVRRHRLGQVIPPDRADALADALGAIADGGSVPGWDPARASAYARSRSPREFVRRTREAYGAAISSDGRNRHSRST